MHHAGGPPVRLYPQNSEFHRLSSRYRLGHLTAIIVGSRLPVISRGVRLGLPDGVMAAHGPLEA